jgi:hypothetical protein
LPNAAQRKQAGGGVQGTASTVQEVEAANKACQQWTWKPLIAEMPLRRGYKVNTPPSWAHPRAFLSSFFFVVVVVVVGVACDAARLCVCVCFFFLNIGCMCRVAYLS